MNPRISVALLAVLFYGGLLWTAVLSSRPGIEGDIKERAEAVLEEIEELPEIPGLIVKGRDLVVEGEVYSQEQLQQVLQAIRRVKGIRVIEML